MRSLRESSGVSLREAERRSGRGRGNLSQIETGKARPNRALVEWYDEELHADGLLLGMYFEARTGYSAPDRPAVAPTGPAPAPSYDVTDTALPQGALVHPDQRVEIGWTLVNTGTTDWTGRCLRRVGAHAGPRLLGSPETSDVPDCPSGETVDVRVVVQTPVYEGTCVAYWHLVAAGDVASYATLPHLSVQLVVRA